MRWAITMFFVVLIPTFALADPWKDESGQGWDNSWKHWEKEQEKQRERAWKQQEQYRKQQEKYWKEWKKQEEKRREQRREYGPSPRVWSPPPPPPQPYRPGPGYPPNSSYAPPSYGAYPSYPPPKQEDLDAVYTPWGYYEELPRDPYRPGQPQLRGQGQIGPYRFEVWKR